MKTGWLMIGGKMYYLASDGIVHTGWQTIGRNKNRYYFDKDGVMAVGDITINGKRCVFNANGVFEKEINCHLDENGEPIRGWHEINGKTYYAFENGELASGRVTIDGQVYEFESVKNGCVLIETQSYSKEGEETAEKQDEHPVEETVTEETGTEAASEETTIDEGIDADMKPAQEEQSESADITEPAENTENAQKQTGEAAAESTGKEPQTEDASEEETGKEPLIVIQETETEQPEE